MALAADAGLRPPSAYQLWSSSRHTVWKIWHILCVCVSRPVTLTFDLLTLKLLRNVARVMGYHPANFGDWWYYNCSFSIYEPLSQHGSDGPRDLVTLTSALGGHCAYGWCGSSSSIRVPSLKFVDLSIRKIWRTMCVSINSPGDFDFWAFDLETGKRVASKVGNISSKFGHARPLGSRIICYVHDGRYY